MAKSDTELYDAWLLAKSDTELYDMYMAKSDTELYDTGLIPTLRCMI